MPVLPDKAAEYLKKRIENGKPVSPLLPEKEQIVLSRKNMEKQLECFDESYKRILNPHIYKVSLSENLKQLKKMFIEANIK